MQATQPATLHACYLSTFEGREMQDIQSFIQPHFWLLHGSIGDSVFLTVLCAGFLFGWSARWTTGIATAAIFAGIRVAIIDWQAFVPGAEPSAALAAVFLFTIVASLLAFATGKFCRMLVALPRRMRR
jgi:hypothetical protein